MRSTNVSPGFDVMRTTIRSDSTRVPPVTALRSPPDSRTTGALSPVMADSSTVAMPATMSPSPGISSPAVTITRSSRCSSADDTVSVSGSWVSEPVEGPTTRRAIVWVRVFRRLAACALPRPSATDSATFAKNTVSQSQIAMPQVNAAGTGVPPEGAGPPRKGSAIARTVVNAAPTHTRSITGLRTSVAGFSLRRAPGSACASWAPLKERGGRAGTAGASCCSGGVVRRVMVRVLRRAVPVRARGSR